MSWDMNIHIFIVLSPVLPGQISRELLDVIRTCVNVLLIAYKISVPDICHHCALCC